MDARMGASLGEPHSSRRSFLCGSTCQRAFDDEGQPMATVTAPVLATTRERRAIAGVPIRKVLELPILGGARLVAGGPGADRIVRSVNVMEVPDILDWVKPDELLLTTAYPLREDLGALAELVPHLVEHGLAGM